MTATFMLQFVMGASSALGGNILRDAFGVVALCRHDAAAVHSGRRLRL